MAVYPAQLTTEEKNLKRRYARLQEKRKLLKKRSDKTEKDEGDPGPSGLPIKQSPTKDGLNPKDAKEVAKKLLMAGKLTIQKQPTRKTGFKRVGELPGQAPSKPKYAASDVKKLYNRFIPSSRPDDLERIPKKPETPETSQSHREPEVKSFTAKDCTVYVRWETDRKKSPGLTEDALRVAFGRFGSIQTVLMRSPEEGGLKTKESSFLTFETPQLATTAKKEMDGGMIRGVDVWVSNASDENGYVELTPEAATNPWAVIAADRDSSHNKQEAKLKSKRSVKVYGPADF
ncbi:hypothetical protein GBAR_LOCUS21739 [Geodia barretti]|uniref:Negative elongation factor E n=1 Tax=Geodia barretti TaxID=519541 RepID=A0AA35X615_GEOBA|nr:hypothetical protein GBAR_LOCUS21739 [Geodia barretti]